MGIDGKDSTLLLDGYIMGWVHNFRRELLSNVVGNLMSNEMGSHIGSDGLQWPYILQKGGRDSSTCT